MSTQSNQFTGGNANATTSVNARVAEQWLARGQAIIPLSHVTKAPLVSGFGADVPDQTIGARFCTARPWRSKPGACIGLLTGRGPHPLVVIDLDVLKDAPPPEGHFDGCQHGADVLELLANKHGAPWPDTYTVLTPSGGLHLYYTAPAGALGNRARALPLVDTRDRGGYVVAAGSVSARGTYEVDVSAPQRPRLLPDWLGAALRPSQRPSDHAQRPPATPAGRDRAEKYAVAALEGAYADITSATDGRKRLIFARARHLAELAHTAPDVLTDHAIENTLLAAALTVGLPEPYALDSIRRGIRLGHQTGAAA